MLQHRDNAFGVDKRPVEELSPKDVLIAAIGFARRRYRIAFFVAALFIAFGIFYLYTTPARFTALASLLMDSRKTALFQQQSVLGDIPVDTTQVESQVEVLKSENVALSVIKELKLTDDPEFVGRRGSSEPSLLGSLFGKGVPPPPPSEYDLLRSAVRVLKGGLSVRRLGTTYVIEIGYTSLSPDKAAEIANAFADAYILDQLDAKYQTTRRAGSWLQDRIAELGKQAAVAERTVLEFKAKNNIVDSGGRLLNEQQLAELNSQLITARSLTAETGARYERIKKIIDAGNTDAVIGNSLQADGSVSDSLKSEVITKLRQDYLEADRRERDYAVRYGPTHLAVVTLRNRMAELRRSMYEELRRIGEATKSDNEIARARQESLEQSISQSVTESRATNQAQVSLRELESSAQSYRALYDNFLQRYMESIQQQSFPVTEARLISRATKPTQKSAPKGAVVLAVTTFLGLIFGFAIAALVEILDRGVRTTEQVEREIEAECIAQVPFARSANRGRLWWQGAGGDGARDRLDGQHLSLIKAQPLSRFAEAIRSIRVAIDLRAHDQENKILGITSAAPNEGKSTIASNLAQQLASTGAKVILVDCDFRNPSLSRSLQPDARVGLLEVLNGESSAMDATSRDPETGLMFLAIIGRGSFSRSSEIIGSESMSKLAKSLKQQFDYVIFDLPPLAPVVDVRTTTHFIDSYIFVAEWAHTRIDVIQKAFRSAPRVYDKLLGVVLNKVDLEKLQSYEYTGAYYGNEQYYTRYGFDG